MVETYKIDKCPFCKKMIQIRPQTFTHYGQEITAVICKHCGATMPYLKD